MTGIVDSLVSVVLFIVVLGGLVLVHELGHFVTARLARVRVLEFGVGFPPRAKVLARGGETLYSLNWLPIGGFVKLEGEDGDDASDPRSFSRARVPVKLIILAAGALMNLFIAFAIFTAIAWFATPNVGLQFDSVDPGSPAAAAGLEGGDAVVSVNGESYDFFSSYEDASPVASLRSLAGETVTLGILHPDGTTEDVTVTLRSAAEIEAGKGALGIRAGEQGFALVFLDTSTGRSLPEAMRIGWSETMRWFGLILEGLSMLVTSMFTDPTVAPPVSGPVGIATSLGTIFRDSGLVMTLYFAGALSANLALVNLLPFPPLDGGRMLMIVLKAIPRYGPMISLRAERMTYAVGFVALFAFLIWITVFDIARQFGGGPTP